MYKPNNPNEEPDSLAVAIAIVAGLALFVGVCYVFQYLWGA